MEKEKAGTLVHQNGQSQGGEEEESPSLPTSLWASLATRFPVHPDYRGVSRGGFLREKQRRRGLHAASHLPLQPLRSGSETAAQAQGPRNQRPEPGSLARCREGHSGKRCSPAKSGSRKDRGSRGPSQRGGAGLPPGTRRSRKLGPGELGSPAEQLTLSNGVTDTPSPGAPRLGRRRPVGEAKASSPPPQRTRCCGLRGSRWRRRRPFCSNGRCCPAKTGPSSLCRGLPRARP